MKSQLEPLYIKLYKELKENISSGRLLPGEKLPTKRAFAQEKGVSLNTVIAVYELAVKNGLIRAAERIGYFVAGDEEKIEVKGAPWSKPDERKYIFSINTNGIKTLPSKLTRARHNAEYDINNRLLSSKEYTGNVKLRECICEYLYKTRRISCTSEQIILASGLNEIMSVISCLLGANKVYAFEDPTEKKLLFSLIDNREFVPISATARGFSAEELYMSGADVFFCMPEKQYPIGYKLSMEQRADLLNWCGRDRFIIEYGLGCDFSFTQPRPSLFELHDNDRVIYINSFDKVTAPGLTTAYMVLPKSLVSVFKEKLWYHHSNVSEYDSLILSEFINNGGIYSNIKRLKKIYEKKRNVAVEELRGLPFANRISFVGEDNGYFFGLDVDTDKKGYELMARCSLKDVKLLPVSCYKYHNDHFDTLFAFGYAGFSEAELKEGIRHIGEAWAAL